MTDRHRTAPARSRKRAKPSKPQKDFPLFAHNNGQWSKKVRGKIHHFGIWADPQAALEKWVVQKDALLAGLTPRNKSDALSISDLANHFLTSKKRILDAGEIKQRTWDELYATCQRLVATFGKGRLIVDLASDDFELLRSGIAEVWGPIRLGNEIQRVRSVFKYAWESGLIENPVRFGPSFKKPSRKVMRKLRADHGPRMFEAKEIRDMLGAASVQLKAMILLGINAGYGNEDCAALPIAALNLDAGWVRFARPKTGIDRKCKLWPETVSALRNVLRLRREPSDEGYKGLLFITKYGRPWSSASSGATAVTHETQKLLVALGIKRPGLNFYALRHTFRTVADGSRDQPATDLIMGHARDEDMATHYRERIEDERLMAVAEHVREWLLAKPTKAKKARPKEGK